MPALAGLTTYGISYGILYLAITTGIVPEDLHFPLVIIWSSAGIVLALANILKGKP